MTVDPAEHQVPPVADDADAADAEVEFDIDDERPPFAGKTAPPPGLSDVDWTSLDDAYGEAWRTPFYIEAITSDDERDVMWGAYGLFAATTHQGSVFSASQAAIPFLARLVRDGNATAVPYLARIALGEADAVATPRDAADAFTEYADDVREHADAVIAMHRAGDVEATRLATLLGLLPATTRLAIDEADEAQAARVVLQGFLAAQANGVHAGGFRERAVMVGHLDRTRELMRASPATAVRIAAAACVLFTGERDTHALEFLGHVAASNDVPEFSDVWTTDLREFATAVWLWAADDADLVTGAHGDTPSRTRALEECARRERDGRV